MVTRIEPSDAMFWKLSCLYVIGIALGCLQVAGQCFSLQPHLSCVSADGVLACFYFFTLIVWRVFSISSF